jgi:uncharacterized protein YceH (UPF0502 family)
MFATIAAAAGGSLAGGAVCGVLALFITGKRIDRIEGALEELVTREEVVGAFARMAEAERQRAQEAQVHQAFVAQQAELQRLQAMAYQQPAPMFRAEAASGAFQAEAGGRVPAPSQDELNARLNQQLASLNQRLQQVTGQQMPQG